MNAATPVDSARRWSFRRELPHHVALSAVLLLVLGILNGLDGIAAVTRSTMFVWSASLAFGGLRAWGWALLALAVVQLCAAVGLFLRQWWARWLGVAAIVADIFAQMVVMPAYPFWSIVIIAVDLLAIFVLCARSDRPTERLVPAREQRPRMPIESRTIPFPQQ